jgi:hypothetical protein
MATHIDLRVLPSNIPSLCIPRVFPNIDEKRIRRIFNDLALGEIQTIDFVSKKTDKGEPFNRIFVHFRRWFSNQNADTARERLLDGKEIKIIYDDPWFWKVSAYRPPAQPAPRLAQKPARPHISFDLEEDDRRPRNDEVYVEENLGRRIKAERKAAQYNNSVGLNKSLRQDAPQDAPPQTNKVTTPKTENLDIPSQVAKRRIIHHKSTKKALQIEEEKQTAVVRADNLEDGEIEE